MQRRRTFVDSSVLIAGFKADGQLGQNALVVLDDPTRDYVTSDFVRLEVLPKPVCYGRRDEREFYETFFENVKRTVRASRTLVEEAQAEAEQFGLSAIDALHVVAARRAGCDELVTAEKPTKPLFSVSGFNVTTIRPTR